MELRVCTSCRKVVPGATTCPVCNRPLTLADPEFFLGHQFGKYRLERVLGTGGMGAVYLATHRTLERPAAVKLVLPQHRDPQFRTRFLREARLMAELSHPNVVEIFDYDVGEWDTPYYVMEYLRGSSLRDLLSRHGRLPPAMLAAVLRDAAAGLGAAHRRGIVHRDLKPENLFVADFDGRSVTKVLDFGIAKAVGRGDEESRLTRTGTVVGTLHYLAPEQILGEPVSPATDQYALALVVAELATGRTVRFGKTLGEIISDEIQRPLELPEDIALGLPEAVRSALRRATSPAPGDRFPDVDAFVETLLTGLEGELTLDSGRTVLHSHTGERSTAAPERRTPRVSRPRVVATLSAVLAAVATLTGLWRLLGASPDDPFSSLAPFDASVVAELEIPADASRVLASGQNHVVLAGADGSILVSLEDDSVTRLAIDPASALGSTLEGELLVRHEGGLGIRSLTEAAARPWVAELPLSGELIASPSGRQLASVRDGVLEVVSLVGDRYRPSFATSLAEAARAVTLGERLAAAVDRERLRVWALPGGRLVLEQSVDPGRIMDLAVYDAGGLVAIGGWSDEITVVRVSDGATFTTRRRPHRADRLALEFLPDGTLAIAEPGGLTLWDPGGGRRADWLAEGADLTEVHYSSGRLLVVDRGRRRLVVIAFRQIELGPSLGPGGAEIWALASDPLSPRVLAGAADGTLHAIDVDTGRRTRHELHSLGITSLLAAGDRLASASDDRTIAVWRLPDLSVEWRSRAHSFLVNQLNLADSGRTLWSSSSDGTLKRWSWPELELQETVSVTDLVDRPLSLHAVWPSPDGTMLLVGTWNRTLIVLERAEDGGWRAHLERVEAFGGYQLVAVPRAAVVVLVGVQHPYGLYAYDLEQRRLIRLPDERIAATWAVAAASGDRVLVFGAGAVGDLRLDRGPNGELTVSFGAVLDARLGEAGAAVLLDDHRVAVANHLGELFIVELDRLSPRPPLTVVTP